jgi:hypothetical protein
MKHILLLITILPMVLSFSTFASNVSFEDRISDMRIKYIAEKKRQDLISQLNQEKELINAYTDIVASRRKCNELGIDCIKGIGLENTNSKLKTIEEEKQLIDAYISLKNARAKCKTAGIDCATGNKLTVKNKTRKPTFNTKKDIIPERPKVIGYINDKVLLKSGAGEFNVYKDGDKLASGFTVKKITPNRMVEISYKEKFFTIE